MSDDIVPADNEGPPPHKLTRGEAAALLAKLFMENADADNNAANSDLIAELRKRQRDES